MRVINLFAGPGAGKSTTAAGLFFELKSHGMRAELVHEAAKRFIYKGSARQLGNQFYVMAKQYSMLVDLEESGCQIAVSDSPLLNNLLYAQSAFYYEQLKALVLEVDSRFSQTNIFIRRTKPFDTFGRTQANVIEAANIDIECRQFMKSLGREFDFEEDGDRVGQAKIFKFVLENHHRPALTVNPNIGEG